MKIIDAHMHFSNVSSFYDAARDSNVDYSYEGYMKEMEACGIVGAVCMGVAESTVNAFPDKGAPLHMLADLDTRHPTGMKVCLGINPHRIDEGYITAARNMIAQEDGIVGFKIYAGYYHYHIHDKVYDPVYRLAAEYGLPVAIHTGDTYAEEALLEYSHPLNADRLAVLNRDVNFVLCHMGDPWIMDACEVAYKNRNVHVDISGLLAGDAKLVSDTEGRTVVMNHYKQGITYLNNYKKVLFGTDWPLVPLGAYIDFCKKLVPQEFYEDVFCDNAVRLYLLNI